MAAQAGSTYVATDGAAYEVFLGRWTRSLAEALIDFGEFSDAGPLLDVGCGTGSLAAAMARRQPARDVVGVDIALPYVEYAKAQYNCANLTFQHADVAALPGADGHFAGAAAQLVLNFVPDPVAALAEMRRVTRRHGCVAACVWDFRGGLVYQRMFWDTAAGIDEGAAHTRDKLFSGVLALPDGLLSLFQSVGFADVVRTSLTIRMDYANFDDYWEPLCGGQGPVGTYLGRLTPELRARIEKAVARAFLSGAPDGPRSLTATAWAVRGLVP